MQQVFLELADQLPAPGTIAAPARVGPLDPLPMFDQRRGWFNTEIVSEQQLSDVSRLRGAYYLSGYLVLLLNWRHEPPSITRDKARRGLAEEFEHALSTRYLVVLRASQPDEPPPPGEVFLFDLHSKRLLCQFALRGGEYTGVLLELMNSLRRATGGTFILR